MKKIFIVILILLLSRSAFSQTDTSLCTCIEREVDKFDNSITLSISGECKGDFSFTKVTKGKVVRYYFYASIYDSYITVFKKGVSMIFSDGSKKNYPDAEIEDKVTDDGKIEYSCFIDITKDIEQFKKKNITDFKMYVFKLENINKENADGTRKLLNCMVTTN